MPERRFPPPWSVEDIGGCFVIEYRKLLAAMTVLKMKKGPRRPPP